jgi:hypothetical protein
VLPVRCKLDLYILFRRNSVFKGLKTALHFDAVSLIFRRCCAYCSLLNHAYESFTIVCYRFSMQLGVPSHSNSVSPKRLISA